MTDAPAKGRSRTAVPRPFDSVYSLAKVTASQWLVEMICQREATAQGGGRLPPSFWKDARWATHFRNQVVALRAAVKAAASATGVEVAVAERAAVSTFNHPELAWMRSFRTPAFAKALRAACVAAKNAPPPPVEVVAVAAPPPPPPATPPTAAVATRAGRMRLLDEDD